MLEDFAFARPYKLCLPEALDRGSAHSQALKETMLNAFMGGLALLLSPLA